MLLDAEQLSSKDVSEASPMAHHQYDSRCQTKLLNLKVEGEAQVDGEKHLRIKGKA